MERIFLDEILNGVLDAAVDRLNRHRGAGMLLDGVRYIGRDDYTEDNPEYPAIIVGFAAGQPIEQRSQLLRWQFPLRFLAIVQDHRSAAGEREARRLAARAFHAICTDPDDPNPLNIPADLPPASYMRAGPFDPPGPGRLPEVHNCRSSVLLRLESTF